MGASPLSMLLLELQLGYLGTLARRPLHCPVRSLVFDADLGWKTVNAQRRRGRPIQEWTTELRRILERTMLTVTEEFQALILDKPAWRQFTRKLCRAMLS